MTSRRRYAPYRRRLRSVQTGLLSWLAWWADVALCSDPASLLAPAPPWRSDLLITLPMSSDTDLRSMTRAFRREGLPFVTLYDRPGGLVALGLNRRGDVGVWYYYRPQPLSR